MEKISLLAQRTAFIWIYLLQRKLKNKLPVMFWIHGGGNTSGLKDLYDFSKFVKKHNVMVVRINYRLGPLGWFTHPAIQSLSKLEKIKPLILVR